MAAVAGFALFVITGWVLFPLLGRLAGGAFVLLGLVGAVMHQPWAGWCAAGGAVLWLAGHWLHTTKTSYYGSNLARILFSNPPLKWTLWQHWRDAGAIRRVRQQPVDYYSPDNPPGEWRTY